MEEIIEILERRGFFIDKIDGKYYLSDNALLITKYKRGIPVGTVDNSDEEFLDQLLRNAGVGYLGEDLEIIVTDNSPQKIEDEINRKGNHNAISASQGTGWLMVKNYRQTSKFPVAWLEINVARYVKVLNAIGVFTCLCCGGHKKKGGMSPLIVEFDNEIYAAFMKLLWDEVLIKKFPLEWKWENNKSSFALMEDMQKKCDILNDAAKYIYENRRYFQDLRMDSMKWMTRSISRHTTDKEKLERFLGEVKKRLEMECEN